MKRMRTTSGITLIEVLSSMLVLSIGVLAMAPMMVLSITGNRFSSDVSSVAAAAQRDLENMIGRGTYPSMPYADTTIVGDSAYIVLSEVKDNTVDNNVPSNVFELSVTVTWTDDTGIDRNFIFSTYTSKP